MARARDCLEPRRGARFWLGAVTIGTIALTVTAIAAVAITARSYVREDTFTYGWSSQDELVLCTLTGKLAVRWRSDGRGVESGWHCVSRKVDSYTLEEEFERPCWGFALERRTHHYRSGQQIIVRKALVSLPVLAGVSVVAALLLGMGLRPALRRRWRVANHMCAACGYDLTGNLSGTCPECGSPAPI